MKRKLGVWSFWLMLLLVVPVYAGSWTKYPPYDGELGGTNGQLIGLGMWFPWYSVEPSTGTIKVQAAAEGILAGYAWAKAWGYIVAWYPEPPPPPAGECPFVYVWDGTKYVIDNNLLPTSLKYNGIDIEDYYKLEQVLVPTEQGYIFSTYSLQIREFEQEHSYFDQIKLTAVDHDPDADIAITPSNRILTFKDPVPPISGFDNNGIDVLSKVLRMDGNVSDPATYFEGYPGDYLVLNFGKVNSDNAKLILRTDMKKEIECIEVQVKDDNGVWQKVDVVAPRAYWSNNAVDLSQYLNRSRDLWVRLFWREHHRLDYVGLDKTKDANIEIHDAVLVSTTHSETGNVKPQLTKVDKNYAELVPGQKISLKFSLPNQAPKMARDFVIRTTGHYFKEYSSANSEPKVANTSSDPVISFNSLLTMHGRVYMYVLNAGAVSYAKYYLKIFLRVWDDTTKVEVTNTKIDEWSHQMNEIPPYEYVWNYDYNANSTFNADLTHRLKIMVGLEAYAEAFSVGQADAYVNVDFFGNGYYTLVQYIYLSWT